MWPQRDGQSYVLLDTTTTDTLVLDQSFFRPRGMQHFYDSFALESQICVRRDALTLFGLNDDELLPDLHITGAGVLQWQEANANRRMQFKVGVYKDSNIRMLTGTIKADWIQMPVERYLTALPTLKQGVIAGVFKNKGAAPWAITRAEKLQLSVFLPNDLSMDEWYAGVYALPTVWPDVSMLGANNLRRVPSSTLRVSW